MYYIASKKTHEGMYSIVTTALFAGACAREEPENEEEVEKAAVCEVARSNVVAIAATDFIILDSK